PVEIPGVSMVNFMRAALNEHRKYKGLEPVSATDFLKLMREKRAIVELDNKLASRSVNEGFSGGEKKRNEIFQMAVLEPKLAVLDETDSGLDIDALKAVAEGVNALRSPDRAFVIITHSQRLLAYIKPDAVHVLAAGRIVESCGRMSALLQSLAEGFDTLPRRDAGGLASARGAALEQALADGLPGIRNERWKYSPLRALERRNFSPVTTLPDFDAAALELPDGP